MIKFIDKNGEVFSGEFPYVHWIGDNLYEQSLNENYYEKTLISGQSTNLPYIKNILVISTSNYLTFEIDNNTSLFKLVKTDIIERIINPQTEEDEKLNFDPDALTYKISNVIGSLYESEGISYYLYQIIVYVSSPDPGQYTEYITITDEMSTGENITTSIGADFYDYDEILNINLENRGTEIPETIQKAIYTNDIGEAYIDHILINRKFKELISNYIDIMDNRGSYKSLHNSLEWFEWGENVKLYEVWKNEGRYFEKQLENILSEQYRDLIYTHQKTTYLSLVSALDKYKLDETGKIELDDEKNPVLESAAQIWSNDVLGLKISLLGAFFERYFMPIHLALKRASVQTRVYTNSIKIKPGHLYGTHHWHDDWGVVDIDMDHTVVLGNIEPVSVGRNTVFGYQDIDSTDESMRYIAKNGGVDYLESVDLTDSYDSYESADQDQLQTIWGNIRGHVGVVVPVTVTVPLPEGDALNAETLVIYRYPLAGKPTDDENPLRIFERRLWKAENIGTTEEPVWVAQFNFNLLSTTEEKVSFTLQMHSLSGHTWTATSTYEAIDTSGATLEAYRVGNKEFTSVFYGEDPWATWNPYEGQYSTIINEDTSGQYIDPSKYLAKTIKQYLPTGNQQKYLNELVVVKVNSFDDLNNNSNIINNYYLIERGINDNKYIMCVRKQGGNSPYDYFNGLDVKRRDYIFVPQLHTYTSIETIPLRTNRYGKWIMTYNDYLVDPEQDLIQIRSQYKYSKNIDPETINWLFENKTTGEKISIKGPQQYPYTANNVWKYLSDGYWSVTMTFKFLNSNKINKLSRNSMFLVQKRKDD